MVCEPAWMLNAWRRPFPPYASKLSKMIATHNTDFDGYKGKPLHPKSATMSRGVPSKKEQGGVSKRHNPKIFGFNRAPLN